MTDTAEVERFEPWEVHGHDLWVRASDYDALAAKLAEVEAERDAFASNIPDAAQNLIRNAHTGRLKALHRAVVAEAELASMQSDALAFVLFLDENYRHSFGDIAREKIRAFYARIQTGEKE